MIKTISLTESDLTELLNQGIEVYVDKLNQLNIIDDSKTQEILQYQIIVSNKKTFCEWISNILWKEDSKQSETRISVVKVLLPKENK